MFRQILSTPFQHKIDQNGLKTTLNGVGRASRGIGELIAPSSSNMSPWGLMADPFKPIFVDFRTFSENQNRNVRNSFRKHEFLMAPLAKVLRGKWSYIDPLTFISLSSIEIRLHFYMSHSTFPSKNNVSFRAIWDLFSRNSVEHLRGLRVGP